MKFLKHDLVVYIPNHQMKGNSASVDDIYDLIYVTEGDSLDLNFVSSVNASGVFIKPYHAVKYNGFHGVTSQHCLIENLLNISEMVRESFLFSDLRKLLTLNKLKGTKTLGLNLNYYDCLIAENYREDILEDNFCIIEGIIEDSYNEYVKVKGKTQRFTKYIILR